MTSIRIDLPVEEAQRFNKLLESLAKAEGLALTARAVSFEAEQPRH